MDYKDALNKLNKLKVIYLKKNEGKASADEIEEAKILYGELEPLITQVIGTSDFKIPLRNKDMVAQYPNVIEAGLLGAFTHYQHDGYGKLLTVIGRVQSQANDPLLLRINPSVTNLIRMLRSFRAACQHQLPPQNEKEIQNIIWIMLRPQFELLKKEETLPKFGSKSYKPDFGEPTLNVLIEAKFIGQSTKVGEVQDQILADVPGYLNGQTEYKSLVVFVYDSAHQLRNSLEFETALKSVNGIIDVIVVPGY